MSALVDTYITYRIITTLVKPWKEQDAYKFGIIDEKGKVLKERLIINHLVTFYNVFESKAATRILFYKVEKEFHPILKTFLVYLNRLSLDEYIEISLDNNIIDKLRGI